MKPSDIAELQRKLALLKMEQEHDDDVRPDDEEEEEPPMLAAAEDTMRRTPPPRHANNDGSRAFFRNRNFKIDDFEIFTTLGTGTFGRVRQVKLRGDNAKNVFALKMMKKTEIVRLNQVEHIKSETKILQEISHPFFVELKTFFQDEKYVYMLFEYVSGGEMFSRLRKEGRFANDVALFYISEILLAIQYLHRQEIVYRDLKPENLLIHRDGHIKITDFGFAKKLTNDRTFTLCGTPEYLAPEIIKGAKVGYGKSVDWWALGVLIFEMLAGYPPFYDNEPIGIYKKIIVGIIEFPQFLSLRAKDIIRKLLNPDHTRRLGVREHGEDVKRHKWFRGVDWDALYRKEIPPPWIPPLKSEEDSSWFDKYPDSKEPAKPLPRELGHLFKDL
jgi:serine/threonine protein kinase